MSVLVFLLFRRFNIIVILAARLPLISCSRLPNAFEAASMPLPNRSLQSSRSRVRITHMTRRRIVCLNGSGDYSASNKTWRRGEMLNITFLPRRSHDGMKSIHVLRFHRFHHVHHELWRLEAGGYQHLGEQSFGQSYAIESAPYILFVLYSSFRAIETICYYLTTTATTIATCVTLSQPVE